MRPPAPLVAIAAAIGAGFAAPSAAAPALPAGGTLVFSCVACGSTSTRELYVIGSDGQGLRRLRSPCGAGRDPLWPASSSHGQLAYVCDSADASTIWIGGTHPHALPGTQSQLELGGIEWSRDGRRLAWHRGGAGGQTWWLVVARADGTDRRAIAKGLEPSWSPHGRLVFDTGRQLATIAPDGRARRPLLLRPGITEPKWSPDGRSVAFVQLDATTWTVLLLRLDDHTVRTLATGDDPIDAVVALAWEPRGRRLAYLVPGSVPVAQEASLAATELWTVDPSTGMRERLYQSTGEAGFGVTWRR